MSEWVSVEEGNLPNRGDIIIFSADFNGSAMVFTGFFDNKSGGFIDTGTGMDYPYEEVTHWMPLPEPPK